MSELTLIALFVILLLFFWPFWQQNTTDDLDKETDDARLTPLLRGINYLLNDDPDLALQELLHVARMRTETAEVYLALGDMFRHKGEIGRAIHVHQSLLARPDLEERLTLETSLALAKDYQSGGFLGRAIQQYEKVLHEKWNHLFALRASLRIHEQTASWDAALACLTRLAQVEQKDMSLHRAYLLVEKAQLEDNIVSHQQQLELAIQVNTQCQHAWIALIKHALHQQDLPLLKRCILQLQCHDPETLALTPIFFADSLQYLHAHFMDCWQQSKSKSFALNWLEAVKEKQGERAMLMLNNDLCFSPDTLATHLRYIALTSDNENLKQQILIWKSTATKYACHACGIRVRSIHWQCPQCHKWGEMYFVQSEV